MSMKALTIAVALLLAGCDYSEKKDRGDDAPAPDGGNQLAGASFQALQKDLFGPFCVSCHNAVSPAGGIALDSLEGVKAHVTPGKSAESDLAKIIAAGDMPPGPNKPSAALQADLAIWIDAGADAVAVVPRAPVVQPVPEEPVPEPTAPAAPTFAEVAEKIFTPRCLPCHAPKANGRPPAHGVALHDYDALVAGNAGDTIYKAGDAAASELYDQVLTGKMPPRGEKLTQEQMDLLKAWIDAGAPRG